MKDKCLADIIKMMIQWGSTSSSQHTVVFGSAKMYFNLQMLDSYQGLRAILCVLKLFFA